MGTLIRRSRRPVLVAGLLVSSFAGARAESFFVTHDEVRYQGVVSPAGERSPTQVDQQISATRVLSRNRERQWGAELGGGGFRIDETLVLPERDWAVTENLGELNGSLSYTRFQGPMAFWGTKLKAGSASDHLFNSLAETTFEFTGIYSKPSGERSAWQFLFQYSNNRSFLNHVPLPGVAYSWTSFNKKWRGTVGFPLVLLSYHPDEAWDIDVMWVGIVESRVRFQRRLAPWLKAYAGYERNPRLWQRANRDNNRNRLIYDAKAFSGGLRFFLGKRLEGEVGGGWAFDRRWLEARSVYDTDKPYQSLDNQPFMRAMLSYRY